MKNHPKNKRLNIKMEEAMIKMYVNDRVSTTVVAHAFGFATHKTVCDVLKKYKIKAREPSDGKDINHDCFSKVDTHLKAYVLGWILTDVYVIGNYWGIGLDVAKEDENIIKTISPIFGKDVKVRIIDRSSSRRDGKNHQDMIRLDVRSRSIANDLRKLNMIKGKTYILKAPKIPVRLRSHFLRGCWDGDGSIGIAKTKNIWCVLSTASPYFAYDLRDMIPFNTKVYDPTKSVKSWLLRISSGNSETKKFLNWMYKNSENMRLERKYERIKDQIDN